jgi:peptidoglycan/LPS O-acetylase OafA/YrhL
MSQGLQSGPPALPGFLRKAAIWAAAMPSDGLRFAKMRSRLFADAWHARRLGCEEPGKGAALAPHAASGLPPSMNYRFRHLDGLRGIAALIVVVSHIVAGFWPAAYFGGGGAFASAFSNTPVFVLISGTFAVYVFLVMSGFVLAGGEVSGIGRLPLQVVARIVRLGIPAGASVGIAFLLLRSGAIHSVEAGTVTHNAWLASYYTDAEMPAWRGLREMLGYPFLTGDSSLNPVLWTMRTELVGSIVVFAVAAFLPRTRRPAAYIALALLAYLSGSGAVFLLIPFMAGALLREADWLDRLPAGPWWPAILAIGLLCGGVPYADYIGTVYEPLVRAVDLVSGNPVGTIRIGGAFLLAAAVLKLRPQVLAWRPAQFLGRISFPLYLIHFPIMASYLCWTYLRLDGAFVVGLALSFVVLAIASAAVMERLIERPSVELSRLIKNRRAFVEAPRQEPA